MSEKDAIERVDEPVTIPSLAADLRERGVDAGDTLIVHSSMSSLGWVSGGAPAVVDAFQRVLTEDGTLVMPTFTPQTMDPSNWHNPPVPDEWEPKVRDTMPPYRPEITPSRGVGAIPECFCSYPNVHRSAHPVVSFAAWGAKAEAIVANHELDNRLGEESPLAELYARDADVLFLGVDHGVNTSLHLAENRADYQKETVTSGSPVIRGGERVWVEYENIVEDTDDFPDVGEAFEEEIGLTEGSVGAATAKLMGQRDLVDFAVEWFERNR